MSTEAHTVIVGLGDTGVSCARHLAARGVKLAITDSRAQPPGLAQLGSLAQQVELRLGGFDEHLLENAQEIVVSPGIPLDEPFIRDAATRGIDVVGDIELFARALSAPGATSTPAAPVIGITGTNGKSTVTTLLARMGEASGLRIRAGGNLGPPALDLLAQPAGAAAAPGDAARGGLEGAPDYYILELSSFQLELTGTLRLHGATVLNVTADHMDRYESIDDYAAAKARIFAHCRQAVVNLDDSRTAQMPRPGQSVLTFSVVPGTDCDYGVSMDAAGRMSLSQRGRPLLRLDEMKMTGLHNAANALAALALADSSGGFTREASLQTLRTFPGLPHRTQWVADINGVRWIDDSKGTNVGATVAALRGMEGPLIVIAGGDGKGQNFLPLTDAFRNKVRHAVLIGKDAQPLSEALRTVCSTEKVTSMEKAVVAAASRARPGDTVLLSPACSSLDMFRDFRHRGEVFADSVRGLAS
jgi:UDP-N-acetylmuramoylalanine--D-glutamate ligase